MSDLPDRTTSEGVPDSSADDVAAERFVALLMAHRHRIWAFIAKQLINPADVEDVFQKTSLVLWKKMDTFDPEGSFFHWACGIAFNEVRNALTVRRRSRLFFDDDLVALLAEEAAREEDLSQARLEALRNCMETLSGRQKDILQRCYAGTESMTDVAHSLGRNRGALYKQVARLRDKLLSCIRLRLVGQGVSQ